MKVFHLALLALLALAGGAGARVAPAPTVELSTAAALAPDRQSLRIDVVASCPERWSLAEARVRVTQGGVTGTGTFPLSCIGSKRPFSVVVRSPAPFSLGAATATATVAASRGGKTATVADTEAVQLQPALELAVSDTGAIAAGGASVSLSVTAACPAGATGERSTVGLTQGNTIGSGGTFTPICDGSPHAFPVTLTASPGTFTAGAAQATVFASTTFAGMSFPGVTDEPVQLSG